MISVLNFLLEKWWMVSIRSAPCLRSSRSWAYRCGWTIFESNISLNLLTNLPVTGLKFDGGFSRRAIEGSNDGAVAHALIDLAHSMNMRVVAEGIEELDQADFFRAQNCDEGQGFLFGRPMGCEELEKLLFESKEVL